MGLVLFHLLCGFFAFLFCGSGVAKLLAHRQFGQHLTMLGFRPRWLTRTIAWGIPLIELALGLGWLTIPRQAWVWRCSMLLMTIFIAFVIWVLRSDKKTSCFCFGSDDESVTAITFWRNVLLLGGLLVIGMLMPFPGRLDLGGQMLTLIHSLSLLFLFLAAFGLISAMQNSRKLLR